MGFPTSCPRSWPGQNGTIPQQVQHPHMHGEGCVYTAVPLSKTMALWWPLPKCRHKSCPALQLQGVMHFSCQIGQTLSAKSAQTE